ncbi:MAG TPA: CvpA family protein [Burkholderiaceae bacterium]
MAALDWILLAVLGASMLLGAWRGLVYEMLSVAAWVAAFFLAQWFAPAAAEWLPMAGAAEPVRYAAGFVLVFVVAVFAGGLVAWLLKKLVEALGLRPVDRTLGMLFGLLRGVVLLLAVTVVVGMTPLHTSPWWQQSAGADMLVAALKNLKPVLPEAFGRHLPS